jgi:D-amino peptidase
MVSVKRGITRNSGESLHPDEACKRIREGARQAIERLGEFKPMEVTKPVTIEMDHYWSLEADLTALIPGVERTGDRTVRFQAPDALEAYRTFLATYYIRQGVSQGH